MVRFYQRWAALRDGDVVRGGVTPMLGRPPNKLWLDPVKMYFNRRHAWYSDPRLDQDLRGVGATGRRVPAGRNLPGDAR